MIVSDVCAELAVLLLLVSDVDKNGVFPMTRFFNSALVIACRFSPDGSEFIEFLYEFVHFQWRSSVFLFLSYKLL